MDKNTFKKSLAITSNVLLIVNLILMLLCAWQEYFYLSIFTISLSIIGIVITLLSASEYTPKTMFKELNTYFFVVSILVCLSVVLLNKVLFYVGVALFVLMILLYFIPLFINEKEDTNKDKPQNNSNNKSGKKKNKKKKK